jgi:hemoglobin-like flavoprotein
MSDSDSFATIFYGHLFEQDPSLRELFTTNVKAQGHLLVRMLSIAVAGLDRPQDLLPALYDLGLHHARYGVKPEQYDLFGQVLLQSLAEFLGEDYAPDAGRAWTAFYKILAEGAIEGAQEA